MHGEQVARQRIPGIPKPGTVVSRSNPPPSCSAQGRGALIAVSAILLLALLPSSLPAGLPQPGMVIYGKITRAGETLTDGMLEWTFTPADGPPVVLETRLEPVEEPDGTLLSYSLLVPFELLVPGYPKDPEALTLGSRPLEVERSALLDGKAVDIAASLLGPSFSLNPTEHVGLVERVDLILTIVEDCCVGDADFNEYVNLDDYAAVRRNFGNPVPDLGDADCNRFVNLRDYAAVRDHFGESCPAPETASSGDRAAPLPPPVLVSGPAAVHVSAWVEPEAVQVGDRVFLAIALDAQSPGIRALSVFLTYDASRLRFVRGHIDTELFNDPWLTAEPREPYPGLVAFSAGTESVLHGSGLPLALLEFIATSDGSADFEFQRCLLGETKAVDPDFNDLATDTQPASVQIGVLGELGANEAQTYQPAPKGR